MKLDQLCFYATHDWQAEEIKIMLGLQNAPWVQDIVTMRSRFPPADEWEMSIAELNFCEALGPQVEIMRFTQGLHWNMDRDADNYFIGHIGLHIADGEDWPAMTGGELMQETRTIAHTAPAFNDPNSKQFGRRYHYRIYNMPRSDNIYIKLIKRIHLHAHT
jgi:hypothetical protein